MRAGSVDVCKRDRMIKAYIWGTGKYAELVFQSVKKELCAVKGFVDSNKEKQEIRWIEGLEVISPERLSVEDFQYVIISSRYAYGSIVENCRALRIAPEKIVIFWAGEKYFFLDYNYRRIAELEEEVKRYKLQLRNAPYELGIKEMPHIRSAEELLELLISGKKSLCRFGDGEFEIMRGRERPWFQQTDIGLAERLKEALHTDKKDILLAVADNFGNLDKYTERAADSIREYMDGDTRQELLEMLGTEQVYYDAYVSRPYIIYKDKTYGKRIFSLWKKLWRFQKVLIVEGENSRVGVGNDLFADAAGVRRILCPSTNAYSRYGEILEAVRENALQDELILVSLGPTATVLAYDLALCGMQAVDIGQLDNEYEWYLRSAEDRVEIEGKVVAELSWCHNPIDIKDTGYQKQIIARITDE